MFLAENLLASLPMLPEPFTPAEVPVRGSAVGEAIARRYGESGGTLYGITPEQFQQIVFAVVVRYAGEASEREQLELVATLRVAELSLARACSAGNEAAWEAFLTRYRVPLYEASIASPKTKPLAASWPTVSTPTSTEFPITMAAGSLSSTTTWAAARSKAGCAPCFPGNISIATARRSKTLASKS